MLSNKIYFVLSSIALLFLSRLLNINISAGLTLIGLLLYIIFSQRLLKQHKRKDLLVVALLFTLFIFITKKLLDYQISVLYIPVIGLSMLVTILYSNLELSLIICILASGICGLAAGGSLLLCLVYLFSAIIAAILAQQLRKRTSLLGAGFYAGGIQMLAFMLTFGAGLKQAAPNLLNGIFCGVFVIAILPLAENLFDIVTNFTLLELSDFNHPLLKKMILEAPGTYHHSLIVGNLAEAAAQSIKANSLLTRIGAYYHDIGKVVKAEYFLENQRDISRHSEIAPSISKIVIMNHIKEGLELAKRYRLKPQIRDFIAQHHGTSIVYYFYCRALEKTKIHDEIREEGFRYPGPKPQTKEVAIVLLADSVEAASRMISGDPSIIKIQELVHKIINNKFIDGQLDSCDLTLKDLEEIAKVFIRMLGGIYHGRIKYPEDTKKNDIPKKHERLAPASTNRQDKKPNPEDP